ncbi:MAG: ABC transporter permease [Opitutaceae bacterium]|nr:ABC transporter permease [Opitutaceae bacterium]MBP9913006.1 ABC transporter permease [Opitutaceae bacterium]
MKLREILQMALGSLGVNKLRSFLTMSGITIGVFSVIGVMTTVSALRGSIETGLSQLGSNAFQFQKYPSGFNNGNNRKYRLRRNLTLEQGQRYQQLMEGTAEVISLELYDFSTAQAMYLNRKTTPDLTFAGGNQYYFPANSFNVGTGRNFTEADIELARPVCIIGQDVNSKLFPAESALGRIIKVRGRTYTVIGVLEARGSSFGQSQDGIIIVPVTRFAMEFGNERQSLNIATQAPSQLVYNETIDKAITAMRIARGLKPEDENDFDLFSNESLITSFAKVADVVAAGSFVISGIALLAAGVGIMNIMLVSVTERTKEIGIRKSIGARKVSILLQFLIESVAISLAGGMVGILIGVVVGNGLASMMNAAIVFPWMWAGIGLLVCSGIGVGFGFYPAFKAASLDPIEALRYE